MSMIETVAAVPIGHPVAGWEFPPRGFDLATLSNGQTVPVKSERRTLDGGATGRAVEWNLIYRPDGEIDPDYRDRVLAMAVAAPETVWWGGCAANYGHSKLYVLD